MGVFLINLCTIINLFKCLGHKRAKRGRRAGQKSKRENQKQKGVGESVPNANRTIDDFKEKWTQVHMHNSKIKRNEYQSTARAGKSNAGTNHCHWIPESAALVDMHCKI